MPSDPQDRAPKPVARGDTAASHSKAGHTLQRSGDQKPDEQATKDAMYPAGRAVRRQPGRTSRGA